ncbi:MAG: hypothetical protein SFX18_01640 [Pirellulales bacterium]|nr:hypothetical protein [Pirellulales bacterium]
MRCSKVQLAALIAVSLGVSGCQSGGGGSWSWNPWAKKDTALAGTGKPNLPSREALADNTTTNTTKGTSTGASTPGGTPSTSTLAAGNANYPQTSTPVANYTQAPNTPYGPAQVVMGNATTTPGGPTSAAAYTAMSTPSTPAYPAQANYMASGFGSYNQPGAMNQTGAVNPTATMAPGSGVAPASYPASNPAAGSAPAGGLYPYTPPSNPGFAPNTSGGTGYQGAATGSGWNNNAATTSATGTVSSTGYPLSTTPAGGTPFNSQAGLDAAQNNQSIASASMADKPNYQPGNNGYQVPNYQYGNRGVTTAAAASSYRPGGTSNYNYLGTAGSTTALNNGQQGNTVQPANYEATPGTATQNGSLATPTTASGQYNMNALQASGSPNLPAAASGSLPSGVVCENGVCLPANSLTAGAGSSPTGASPATTATQGYSHSYLPASGGTVGSGTANGGTGASGSLYR